MVLADMPPGYDPELWALVAPLRVAMIEQGLTYGQLGYRLGRHRSRVSRALSGRALPARDRVLQLARILRADETAVERQWGRAADKMRDPRARWQAYTAGGAPPARLTTHMDLMHALRGLLRDRGISQRELERLEPELRRSTVGAVLRGQRGAHLDQVAAIVRTCGVRDEAARAWEDAWARLSLPDLDLRLRRGEAWLRARAVPRRELYRW